MKSLFIKSFAALAGLAMLFWTLSCGTSAPTTTVSSAMTNPCAATDPANRVRDVQRHIENAVNGDTNLKAQQNDGKFDFRVRGVNGTSPVVVWAGKIQGEKKFETVSNMLNTFQQAGCIQRIRMIQNVADIDNPRVGGFEWSFCEDPLCPAPGGNCVACLANGNTSNTIPSQTPNMNTGANRSGNSNSGGGNSNSPRP